MTSKPVSPAPSRACAQAEQRHALFQRAGGGQRGARGRRPRLQLQRGRGDDAQRAFAADEQVAQVVAGVVLAQARQAVPHLAVGGHHLQAQAQLARIAVAQHLGAAGIGGQVAADGATALGGQAQRQQQPGVGRGLLQRLQHAAGLGGERQVGAVDGAHAVQARQAEQHLRAAGIGHAAADQAGVAALRHHAGAVRGAGPQHGSHLRGVGRAHHGQRTAAEALAPVQLPGRQVAIARARGRRRRPQRSACSSAAFTLRPPRAARCNRQRTCSAQATNSTRHSSTSMPASTADKPLSVVARTTPSVK